METRRCFAAKLREMERQYQDLHDALADGALEDAGTVRALLTRLRAACAACAAELAQRAAHSRSGAVARLSEAQLEYDEKVRRLLASLPEEIHSEASDAEQDRAEALALYAEFALDLAAQSMRGALIAALTALEAQPGGTRKEEALP